ncbi:MAG: hypothetical protein HZC01_05315 [Candidatus Kerfeldbacteria bacterium]|nr:hypothetical protein [Candidatus Kerfeldbacteria bacterium]
MHIPNSKQLFQQYSVSIVFWLKRHIALAVNSVVLILLIILAQFIYTNVYLSVINPEPIDQTEIIARRKKVNTTEFETALNQIQQKQTPTDGRVFKEIANPFD